MGEVSKKPGTTAMQTGLVIVIVGVALMVLNGISEGQPPAWTVWTALIGVVVAVIGYAMRILAAVESR